MNSGWPYSTGWPFSTRISLIDAALIGLDLVEQLHGLDDAQGFAGIDRLADFHEGLWSPGADER